MKCSFCPIYENQARMKSQGTYALMRELKLDHIFKVEGAIFPLLSGRELYPFIRHCSYLHDSVVVYSAM